MLPGEVVGAVPIQSTTKDPVGSPVLLTSPPIGHRLTTPGVRANKNLFCSLKTVFPFVLSITLKSQSCKYV